MRTGLTIAGALASCTGPAGEAMLPIDADGDGFTVAMGDCDDLDPELNPGANWGQIYESEQLIRAFEQASFGTASACEVSALAWVAHTTTEREVGPWGQEVRLALSDDALNFSDTGTVVVSKAGVPEVVLGDDGMLYLYVVDGDWDHLLRLAGSGSDWVLYHGFPGKGAIRLYRSEDGVSFTEVEEFGIEPSEPGAVARMNVDPEIVRVEDGSYMMYFVSLSINDMVREGAWDFPNAHDVRRAVSTDLVHWYERGVAVVGPYADPAVVVRPEGDWMMLSFGMEWSESADVGLSFDFQGYFPSPGGKEPLPGFAADCMLLEDESHRCWFNSMEGGAPIYTMASEDGYEWILEEGDRLDWYGTAPSTLIHPDLGWIQYFHTFMDEDDIPQQYWDRQEAG